MSGGNNSTTVILNDAGVFVECSRTFLMYVCVKPRWNENASQRKFELASRLNTNLLWLAVTCVNFEHAQISLQVEVTCFKLARACDSFEWYKRKLPQVNLRWLAFSFERGLKEKSNIAISILKHQQIKQFIVLQKFFIFYCVGRGHENIIGFLIICEARW
jgi:hypothetical protein